jgi:hypothetical protein
VCNQGGEEPIDARDKKPALVGGEIVIWGIDSATARHWARPVRADATSAGKAFIAALRVIRSCPEFRARYEHPKVRAKDPLRKPQAEVAVATQLIGVLFAMAKARRRYDPAKLAPRAHPAASVA